MTYEFEVRTMEAGLGGKFTKTVESNNGESAWIKVIAQLDRACVMHMVVSITLLGRTGHG